MVDKYLKGLELCNDTVYAICYTLVSAWLFFNHGNITARASRRGLKTVVHNFMCAFDRRPRNPIPTAFYGESLPDELKEDLRELMPGLTFPTPEDCWEYQWRTHGYDTGLSPLAYFTMLRDVARSCDLTTIMTTMIENQAAAAAAPAQPAAAAPAQPAAAVPAPAGFTWADLVRVAGVEAPPASLRPPVLCGLEQRVENLFGT